MRGAFELDTARLTLRQWRESDNDPFADLCADPEVMRFFVSSVHERATSTARITKWSKQIEEKGWGFWALEVKSSGKFVGFAGLQAVPQDHPYTPSVEIGWRLARNQWGLGYPTEAAKAALDFGFGNLQLPEIIATTAVLNARSRAVMARLGMQGPETIFRFPEVPIRNPLCQHALYRLSCGQWRSRSAT